MDGKYSFERMDEELDNGYIIFYTYIDYISYLKHQKTAIHNSYLQKT